METNTMTLQVFTANRLGDGAVVYLTTDGGWSESIGESRIAGNEAALSDLAHRAAQAEKRRKVIGAYAVEVAIDGAVPHPVRLREAIRATGPTAASDSAQAV
mgnify:CR=1 FL=1